jgi:hypothetical protein
VLPTAAVVDRFADRNATQNAGFLSLMHDTRSYKRADH